MAPKMSSSTKSTTSTFVLGTTHFDKISAVEGLAPSRAMLQDFRTMDSQGMTSEERLRFLKAKYGRMPALR